MTKRYDLYHPLYFNDRRRGQDRRKFLYTFYLPERRTGVDRRSRKERRSFEERREVVSQMINQTERREILG